ncbi:MAG: hypothetical protein HRF44_06220 [Ignavibacterium sp.]
MNRPAGVTTCAGRIARKIALWIRQLRLSLKANDGSHPSDAGRTRPLRHLTAWVTGRNRPETKTGSDSNESLLDTHREPEKGHPQQRRGNAPSPHEFGSREVVPGRASADVGQPVVRG